MAPLSEQEQDRLRFLELKRKSGLPPTGGDLQEPPREVTREDVNQAPPPPETPSLGSRALQAVGSAATGLVEGVDAVLGLLPGDPQGNLARSATPDLSDAVTGKIREATAGPVDAPQKLLNLTAEEAGAAVPGLVAGGPLASGATRAGRISNRTRLAGEAGAVVGGGTGRFIGSEFDEAVSEFLGAGGETSLGLAGGIAGALLGGVGIGNVRAAEREIGRSAANPARARSEIDRALQDGVEGVELDASGASRDPGIARLQRAVTRVSPRATQEATDRLRENQGALVRAFSDIPGEPERARVAVETRLRELELQDRAVVDESASKVRLAQSRLRPADEVSGEGIRRFAEMADEATSSARQHFRSTLAAHSDVTVNSSDLKRAVADVRKQLGIVREDLVPAQDMAVIRKLVKSGEQIPLEEIQNLRSRLSVEERRLRRDNPNASAALTKLRQSVDEVFDRAIDLSGNVEGAQEIRAARDRVRRAKARFNDGLSGRILRSATDDSVVSPTLAEFFPGGRKQGNAMRLFLQTAKGDEELLGVMNAYVVSRGIEASLDAAGEVDPRRLSAFVQANQAALNQLPDASRSLGDIEGLSVHARDLAEKFTRSQADVERSAAAIFAGDIRSGVRRALDDPAEMRRLVDLTSSGRDVRIAKEAMEGLRRAVWDDLIERSTVAVVDDGEIVLNGLIDPRRIMTALNRHGKALSEVFPRDHMSRLGKIMTEMDRIVASAPGELAEPARRTGNRGLQTIASTLITPLLKPTQKALRFASRREEILEQLSSEERRAIAREMLSDPELTAALLGRTNQSGRVRAERAIRSSLVTLGLRTGEDDVE